MGESKLDQHIRQYGQFSDGHVFTNKSMKSSVLDNSQIFARIQFLFAHVQKNYIQIFGDFDGDFCLA